MHSKRYCRACGAQSDPSTSTCSECGASLRATIAAVQDSATAKSSISPLLAAGERFGAFLLHRTLGAGGFAQVWEAEHLETGRRVALKVLTELRAQSGEHLERFKREGRLAAALSHPRCVYIFGATEVDGVPIISMELMSGGTLQDIAFDEPLSTTRAVDYVLDIIEGLEAASAAGIIHRDIKPSNCFLGEDGRAKIGDFGISKSLEVESHLSMTGSFLGTPYYASPEQVAGEDLDLRSDLYSVGATLYELLTGSPPFTASQAAHLLAQVMTKAPTPFVEHEATVPPGLQRVVLRALAKEPDKRYQGYEEFRAALLPYSSRRLNRGALAKRFGAYLLDLLVLSPLTFVNVTRSLAGTGVLLPGIISAGLMLLYFSLLEGSLGWSVGKRVFGLRVVEASGAPVTRRAAFGRGLAFVGVIQAAPITSLVVITVWPGAAAFANLSSLAFVLTIVVLMSTMRRANGFAGLHEIASGTRVIDVRPKHATLQVPDRPQAATVPTDAVGPYSDARVLWQRDGERLVAARDEALDRAVWIHWVEDPSSAPSLERLRAHRSGSLPWLQRSADDESVWDAYGRPDGSSLVQWVSEAGPLTWHEMRAILQGIAAELAARLAERETAGPLSLDHIWIDDYGRAKLLDFPVSLSAAGGELIEPREITADNWRWFLRTVAAYGLQGQTAAEGATGVPRVPLPAGGREALELLNEGVGAHSGLGELVESLERQSGQPARLTRLRRVAPMAMSAIPPVFGALLTFMFAIMLARFPELIDLGQMDRYESALADVGDDGEVSSEIEEAIHVILAALSTKAEENPAFYAQAIGALSPEQRVLLDSAVARYPAPTPEQVAGAREVAAVVVPSVFGGQGFFERMWTGVWIGALTLGFFSIVATILAFILRGSLLFHGFGIQVQTLTGERPHRLRCAVRSLVAWFPLLAIALLAPTPTTSVAVAIIAMALGAVYAIVFPTRGVADRVAGTVLVPK